MAERFNEFDEPEEKSKSQIKRELQALRDLGKELLDLPIKDLNKLDLSERLYEALLKAENMTKTALKRQIGFIGGLMVHEEHDEIKQNIEKIKKSHNGEKKQFHQLEQWRDALLAGDNAVITELREQFDMLDVQHIRQLVRNANKEASPENSAKPPKSARLLFKYLQECQAEKA